ncbi:MAG: flippase-like domain-containing protein [candidate division Zixibacteria bacterium]|nr:flippase-like domain-containing protein [candidate division Zixibacteria bacterium]
MIPDTTLSVRTAWRRLLVPVGVSAVTLTGLALTVDTDGLIPAFKRADPWLIGLAALKLPLLILLWSLRWHLVIRAGKTRVPFRYMIHAALVRAFFNNLTPGVSTGGEPFGAWYLSKRTPLTFREAVASTAAERMVQGMGMVVLLLATVFVCLPILPVYSGSLGVLYAGMGGFLCVVGFLFYVSLFRFHYLRSVLETLIGLVVRAMPSLRTLWDADRVGEQIDGFYSAYRTYLKSPAAIGAVTALTFLQAGLDILQPYILFQALGVSVPLPLLLLTANLSRILGIFAFTPGGSGLIEAANLGMYHGLSTLSPDVILAETILFRLLNSWLLWIVSGSVTGMVWSSNPVSSPLSERNDNEKAPVSTRCLLAHRWSAR